MADDKGAKTGCIGALIIAGVALFVLFLLSCTVKVPADKFGVRTQLTSSGVEKVDHGPGYVLCIPGLHTVRLWDTTWTSLKQSLQVRGSDQYTTQVDISIVFRIQPGKCHEVALKFRDEEHVDQVVVNILNKYASEILAQMKTEDFYNSKARQEKSDEALKAMHTQLAPDGLEVKELLLRNIVYDNRFEQQLLQKQLAGQRKSLEVSKGLLAGAQTELELISRKNEAEVKRIEEGKKQEIENLNADTDRKIAQLLQDAKNQAATIAAKADSSKRQKIAQAELIRATAAATGTELMSKVYSRPGARFYFARKALEGIKLGEIEVNSNTFNPLDSERLLQALGLDLKLPPPAVKPPLADPAQRTQPPKP